MKRIIIINEGPTEQEFCKDVLYPYFSAKDIYIETPTIKSSHGGIVAWNTGSSSNLVQVILSWKARPFVLTVQIQPCHTSLFSCFLICLHAPPQLHYSKGI